MIKLLFGAGFSVRGKEGHLGDGFVSVLTDSGEINFGFTANGTGGHAKLTTASAREIGSALLTAAIIRDASDRAKVTK